MQSVPSQLDDTPVTSAQQSRLPVDDLAIVICFVLVAYVKSVLNVMKTVAFECNLQGLIYLQMMFSYCTNGRVL